MKKVNAQKLLQGLDVYSSLYLLCNSVVAIALDIIDQKERMVSNFPNFLLETFDQWFSTVVSGHICVTQIFSGVLPNSSKPYFKLLLCYLAQFKVWIFSLCRQIFILKMFVTIGTGVIFWTFTFTYIKLPHYRPIFLFSFSLKFEELLVNMKYLQVQSNLNSVKIRNLSL